MNEHECSLCGNKKIFNTLDDPKNNKRIVHCSICHFMWSVDTGLGELEKKNDMKDYRKG